MTVADSLLSPRTTASLSLADLPTGRPALIRGLADAPGHDAHPGVLHRLAELGFTAGETVQVLQRGPGGREPIAVQVGDTVFALRRYEASCIQVHPVFSGDAMKVSA